MWHYLKRLLIGKPLKSTDEHKQTLNRFRGLAVLSSDALSSIAYGTEQITTTLLMLSAAALVYQLWIAALVLIVLLFLTLSYLQIIKAYPSGGGAYQVADENWGYRTGLVAGGSLLIDYMLTVAVSTVSGTLAITSAFPFLARHQILLACSIVLITMLINLRGVQASSRFLVFPVYFFILMIIVMVIGAVYQILTGHLSYQSPVKIGGAIKGMTIFLFLKAFSSGSASLTGIEATSNTIPNFKKPQIKHAQQVLVIMALVLGGFFAAVTYLSYYLKIVPNHSETVLSQMGAMVFGRGIGYYLLQTATLLVLFVAANTGFSAFPILAYNMAKKSILPHAYLDRGDRLGYSNGIISLSIGAIILIIIFRGNLNWLVPLYAIGVFVPFTLSQSGMVRYWYHHRGKAWLFKALIDLVGASIALVLVVSLLVFHFFSILPYLIVMPILIKALDMIKQHYQNVEQQLSVTDHKATNLAVNEGSTVIVLISSVTKVTEEAINYANSIGTSVIAMHISFDDNLKKEQSIAKQFKELFPEVRFVDIHSSYRSIIQPTLRFCDVIAERANRHDSTTTVLVPQFVPRHAWQQILHNQSASRLRTALNSRQNIVVSTFNYHLND